MSYIANPLDNIARRRKQIKKIFQPEGFGMNLVFYETRPEVS